MNSSSTHNNIFILHFCETFTKVLQLTDLYVAKRWPWFLHVFGIHLYLLRRYLSTGQSGAESGLLRALVRWVIRPCFQSGEFEWAFMAVSDVIGLSPQLHVQMFWTQWKTIVGTHDLFYVGTTWFPLLYFKRLFSETKLCFYSQYFIISSYMWDYLTISCKRFSFIYQINCNLTSPASIPVIVLNVTYISRVEPSRLWFHHNVAFKFTSGAVLVSAQMRFVTFHYNTSKKPEVEFPPTSC